MAKYSAELFSKLKEARSQEDIAALLGAAGKDAAQAEEIWNEVQARSEMIQLDIDELESVTGGVHRDWLTEGCAATVEPGSHCGSNDSCWWFSVVYDHEPIADKCKVCGGTLYYYGTDYATNPSDDVSCFKCVSCGNLEFS